MNDTQIIVAEGASWIDIGQRRRSRLALPSLSPCTDLSRDESMPLPVWLPKGTERVEELKKLAGQLEFAVHYVRAGTPHLAKKNFHRNPANKHITRRPCYSKWKWRNTPSNGGYLPPLVSTNCKHNWLTAKNKRRKVILSMSHEQSIKPCGVEIGQLSFSYSGRALFDSFSLRAKRKRIVLKGPSGCGKTTLLKLLFGSLPHNQEAVLPEISNPVMVLQEDALFPWLTGRANIERFLPISSTTLDTHSLFPVVSAFIERPAYQMSYGQRRSIELFRAMLLKPTALFLDEPFNYLDDAKAAAFINHIVSPEWHPVLLIITTHRHDTSLDAASEVFLFEGEPPFGNLSKQS